jgi:hypothetical protein
MAAKWQALKAIEALGASIDERNSIGKDILVDAPVGKVFKSSGLHYFCIGGESEPDVRMPEIWDSVIEEVADGIKDCDDEDCEVCSC